MLIKRFLSAFIDGALIYSITSLILLPIGIFIFGLGPGEAAPYNREIDNVAMFSMVSGLFLIMFALSYYTILESRKGRTLGKRIIRIRVIDEH